MKKTITLILAASALTLALGATACNTGGISLGGTSDTPASSESVYGVSAATAGMLIPDFDDDDWWEDEEEEEYAIEGVLVIDGMEYPVQGVREIERERDEYESETEFRVTLEDGRSVWVEQSESSEKDEHELEYSYLIRENGRVVERSSFSFEEEKGETELEMITEKNGKRESFSFEKETYRGREYIFLRVGSGRETKSYLVVSDGNGGYTYEEVRR